MKAPETSPFQPCTRHGQPLELAMQHLRLEGTVTPAGARLLVRHSFVSGASQPLEIVYAFALPRDAAVRRFVVHTAEMEAHAELKPREEAREQYERALDRGHLATLAETYRDGVVNLTVGNVKPQERVDVVLELLAGVDLTDSALRFRFPFTVAPCYHPHAIQYESAPGVGTTELPLDSFGDVFLPPVARPGVPLHAVSFRLEVVMPHAIRTLASPSHHLHTTAVRPDTCIVELATDADVPNRDLVLDVSQEQPFHGVLAGVTPRGTQEFCAVVASSVFGIAATAPRRIVFVLDRSGSMDGSRILQARRAVLACLGALEARDEIGFIAFNNVPEQFAPTLRSADDDTRAALRAHVEHIEASGGTELQSALECAVQMLGTAGGDILLITDGEVSETEAITAALTTSHVHVYCLGIGDASQDRFLTHLARTSGGASRYLTANERVDTAVLELFAAMGIPVAANVAVALEPAAAHAVIEPPPATRVLSGRPLVIYGCCDAHRSDAALRITWGNDGATEHVTVPFTTAVPSDAETLRLVRGARLISDVEATYTGDGTQREQSRLTRRLVSLAQEFHLANRAMALVAVLKRPGDHRGALPRTTIVPVGMPADADFDAYFAELMSLLKHGVLSAPRSMSVSALGSDSHTQQLRSHACGFFVRQEREPRRKQHLDEDVGTTIAAALLSDGGLPGKNIQTRVLITLAAALALHALQMQRGQRTFATHLGRMQRFITSNHGKYDPRLYDTVALLLSAITHDVAVEGNWATLVMEYLKCPQSSGAELALSLMEAAARVAREDKR